MGPGASAAVARGALEEPPVAPVAAADLGTSPMETVITRVTGYHVYVVKFFKISTFRVDGKR